MKVLMLSGDKNLLAPGTEAAKRLALQKSAVDELDVLVWPQAHSWSQVLHTARQGRYDVVTAQDPFWRGLLAWRAAKKARAKLNIQVHADLSGQGLVKRALARFILRRADSIRVVSEEIKKQVERVGVEAPTRILPIHLDLETFRTITPEPHDQKTVLWIGRFETEKDPFLALEILKEVRQAGIDAKLIMLGAGSHQKALQERARALPVEFPGWRDPRIYLQTADVVLSTSPRESYGASIVEALAAGVPVVASDVGIAKEAGAIVAPRENLAGKVIEVLRSGARGELKLPILSAEEWKKKWKETLV